MNRKKPRNTKHGAWLWLKKRQVPADAKDISSGIRKIAAELADEFAPNAELTPSQLILIDRISALLGFCKLVERKAMTDGVIVDGKEGQRLAPGLSGFYVAATNAVAKAMRTLKDVSPNREAGKPLGLAGYLKAKAETGKHPDS